MVETAIDGVGNGFEIASLKTPCTQCWRQILGLKTPISSGSAQPGFFSGSKIWQNPTSKNPTPFSNFKGAQNLAMSAIPTPKPQILSSDTEKERKKERQSSPRYGCDQRDNGHRQARY
jgi:hypothetical protein